MKPLFRSYLATAFKSLSNDKALSMINILGLSLGLSACLLITFYVQNEYSYDKHWRSADRIFRITSTIDRTGGSPETSGRNSTLLLPALREYFADEIEASSQTYAGTDLLLVDGRRIEQAVTQVERQFPLIFDVQVLVGSIDDALRGRNGLALSQEVARKLFGRDEVVGEVVTLVEGEQETDLTVEAVYLQPEDNSVFALPALRLANFDVVSPGWLNHSLTEDYVMLRSDISPARLSEAIPAFTDTVVDITSLQAGANVRPSERVRFDLQNIQDIYLDSSFEAQVAGRGSAVAVQAFSLIAVLVLLVGSINFTILSMCKATRRLKEAAIRKTLGAGRSQLVSQYLGEILLTVIVALGMALALAELLLPLFETIVGKDLRIVYSSAATWLILAGLTLIVSLLGGVYPALFLANFNPRQIDTMQLRAKAQPLMGLGGGLVMFQFAVCIALIAATAVIYLQTKSMTNRDPGFNPGNLLIVDDLRPRPEVRANRQALKEQVRNQPGVLDASLSGHQPMEKGLFADNQADVSVGNNNVSHPVHLLGVDQDFFKTYQISVVAGRDFDAGRDPLAGYFSVEPVTGAGIVRSIVINESAARLFGFSNPVQALGRELRIGAFITEGLHYFSVVGIAEDTLFHSLKERARPEVYIVDNGVADTLTVRYSGDPEELLSRIREVWEELMGDASLSVGFVSQNMANELREEVVAGQLLAGFASFAILIACLGLFASASFTVKSRTREIGIRKVMGAEILEILRLLLWRFSKPVLLANVLAWPLSHIAMTHWLSGFVYRIDLTPMIFIGSGLVALCIAWVTVGSTVTKAASQKPVLVLRHQ